ncbi:MAG: putative quinol monooxygenase [Actinomycetota bacterium]
MLTVRVVADLRPEGAETALAQLRRESTEVPERFPGCRRFDVFVDPAEPNRFLLYEEWDDQDAFSAYRESNYFAEAGAILFPLIDGAPDSAYYRSERVGP